jgi:type I site-specific restriction-modification system R (restriction) subunit
MLSWLRGDRQWYDEAEKRHRHIQLAGIDKNANTRNNIYVFIDEAHRSVAHDLGTYMMAAVPNATIIGFTGTPIARTAQGEGTFKIFGIDDEQGYLDKYPIRESIEDETTLPLRHTMAPREMTVPADRLDKEFFDLADAEGVTDIDELNRVLDRAVGLRTFLTADDRVEKVAAFVAEHFKENILPLGYKAFLVGVNREACANYKRALDKFLPTEWSEAVYTENAADLIDRPLAERILKDLEDRKTTGLAAMDLLAALAKEKQEAVKGAQDSGLSSRAYGVYWSLKDNDAFAKAGISALQFGN